MSDRHFNRKPWPMKWVVAAIVVFIAGYTYLTLHFRKPGPEYRPYEDMRNRANTLRLIAAGYRCFEIPAERPVDAAGAHDNTFPAPGGLPSDLRQTIVATPLLPAEIGGAHVPPVVAAHAPYPVLFRCTAPDDRQQLAGAEIYVKGDRILITPDFQILAPGLLTRSRDTLVLLTIPGGTLKPGTYRISLVGQNSSRSWTAEITP